MNVRLFGLEISADGALRAIKQVTDASAKMATDGAKSAQQYADATREKLNRVAREYIPETVRAIEKLTSAQKALAQSSAGSNGTLPGLLSASEVSSAVASYDKLFGAQQKVAAGQEALATSSGGANAGLGRIRQGLTSLVSQMTGTIPVLDRIGGQFLQMGLGGNIAIGVIAGIAAIAATWRALTRDTREAAQAQDEAAKKLEEFSRKRHLDSGGEFGEQVAGEAGHTDRLLKEKGSIVALQTVGGAVGGLATVYDLFAGKTDKSVRDAVQALRDGRQVIGTEVTKNFLDIQGKESATLAENIKSNNATHAERLRAASLLKQDLALMAQYKQAGVSGELRSQLGSQIESLDSALNPEAKKTPRDGDAGRLASEQRTRENIAEQEERRVEAAQKLAAAAGQGQAAYDREVHSQQLQNQLLETEQRIRASFLDNNQKQRAGTEGLMQAEIERAKAAVQTRDALDQQARAQLDIGKDEQTLAVLKAKTDAYATMGSVVKDATVEEEYAVRMTDAASIADEELRKKKEALAAAIRAQTIALHGAEAAHAAEQKAAADSARQVEQRMRQVAHNVSNAVSGALDALGQKNANFWQTWWDTGKRGINRFLGDIAGSAVASKFGEMMGVGPSAAATKQVAAGTVMLNAATMQLQAASLMAGGKMFGGLGETAGGHGGIADASAGGAGSSKLGAGMGYAAIVAGAGLAGYNVGGGLASTSHSQGVNNARGAIGGAAAGALAGAAIGSVVPVIGTAVGAVVGAVVGAIGGLIGAGNAMKQSAREAAMAVAAFNVSMDALTARNSGEDLKASIAAVNAERVQLAKAIEEAWSGGDANSDRVQWRTQKLKEMNAAEDAYIAQLQKEAALKLARQAEDFDVRAIRADAETAKNQGRTADAAALTKQADDAAFENQRRREREDLQKSFGDTIGDLPGESEAWAAYLKADAAEVKAHYSAMSDATSALNAFSTAVRHAPTGFKIEPYIQEFATAAKRPPTWTAPAGNDTRPSIPNTRTTTGTVATAPITITNLNLTVTGATDGKKVAKEFLAELDRTKNATKGLNGSRAAALEVM